MAVKTDTELKAVASTIVAETAIGGNTKTRVGNLFRDIVDSKLSFRFWNFADNAGTFPTASGLTLYWVEDTHGTIEDPDYVAANSWMIGEDGANEYADYMIKP